MAVIDLIFAFEWPHFVFYDIGLLFEGKNFNVNISETARARAKNVEYDVYRF